ncbi:hypothetical protein E8E13_008111 [Curvularia kusanoi]|uniref:Extracellular mutant protein 11 C-terminal domain-containing protein n=1 Tax=Curvularia kusanoi TaxID=90978 RepID=A0A9P4W9T4_CURKU|nr:hypothetical protein E8E13_008111 [Curvularia kusanoi]
MSGMQNFVRGNRDARAASPQNRPSSKSQRQIIAANAKVPMRPHIARPPAGQSPSVHSESATRHEPSLIQQQQQQHVQQRLSGAGQRDPWETDTASIDSTANQSVVLVRGNPRVTQQQMQFDHEENHIDDDREARSEDAPEESEQDEYSDELVAYFAEQNMANATSEEKEAFLRKSQPQLFGTIDGDSYPTTTDGDPTIQHEQHEQRFVDLGSPPPSSEGLLQTGLGPSIVRHQPLQRDSPFDPFNVNAAAPHVSTIWTHGAHLREKQRTDGVLQAREQPDQSHIAASLPRSQSVPHNIAPAPTTKHTAKTRAKAATVIQPRFEPALSEEPPANPSVDYDSKVLYKMNYDQLKDESFDTDPRAPPSVLPEDVRSQPLPARLEYAQQLDPVHQSEFFGTLSTNEWEDAGDWFLDKFSAIIKKTKSARQKKRAAAQELEEEIETRHQHVTKKRRLVEDAMVKMQAQGEGLVPKSPMPSKSPRPRKV